MLKTKKVLIALFLGIVMMFSVAGCNVGTQKELQNTIDGLQSQIEEMEDRLAEMEEQIRERDEKIEQLERELAEKSVGTFYTLQEAYDNGWLTQADLMSIAYYHNGGREDNEEIMSEDYEPAPKTPEVLSNDIAKAIKRSWAKKLKDDNPETDITEEEVDIEKYYGTYNECVAVIVDRIDAQYPAVYAPITIEIGNVSFNYNFYGPVIIVFKF